MRRKGEVPDPSLLSLTPILQPQEVGRGAESHLDQRYRCGRASLTSELSAPVEMPWVFPLYGSAAWALQVLPF